MDDPLRVTWDSIDAKILLFKESSLTTYFAAEERLVLHYSTLPKATDQGLVSIMNSIWPRVYCYNFDTLQFIQITFAESL